MKQNAYKFGFVILSLLCVVVSTFGQILIKAEKTTEQEKSRSSSPQLRTILYTFAQFTPFEKNGTRTPLSVSLEQIRVDTSVSPWRTISKKRLFQVNEEAGIHTFHPSPDYDQVIVAFQHADFVLTFFQINDLEWVSSDGKRKKRLTRDRGGYHDVIWSPDQKRIAYASRQGMGRQLQSDSQVKWAVYSHDLKTGKRKKLYEERRENPADPSPVAFRYLLWLSPTQLLYTSTYPQGLFLLDIRGKPPILLTKNMPDAIFLKAHLALWYNYKAKQIRMATLPADLSDLSLPQTWNTIKLGKPYVFPGFPPEMSLSSDGQTLAVLVSTERNYEAPRSLILLDVKTRKLRFVGSTDEPIYGLQWTKDGKSLTMLLDPRSENPKDKLHKSIVGILVPAGEGIPFEQFDWNQKMPLKYTELFAFPEGTEQVSWSDEK